jgi:ArsR family transcriptional regulator
MQIAAPKTASSCKGGMCQGGGVHFQENSGFGPVQWGGHSRWVGNYDNLIFTDMMRRKMPATDITDTNYAAKVASGDAAKDVGAMTARAAEAAGFLKALSHEGRLMILCHIANGEKSVTELEALLHMRQAAVSQQLARLRDEGLVSARRDGKTIYYSISDARVRATVGLMYQLFCGAQTA